MELITLNPWWEHESAINLDKHIRALEGVRFVYESPLLDEEYLRKNVYTLRGPRQIGKTTFLKLLIRKKLETVAGRNILYWSCDNLRSREDLIDLIKEYSDFCKVMNAEPEYIFLDEITEIPEWQKAIKFLVDNDICGDACYVLTGSNAIDLRKGSERLPGRRGEHGKDLFMLPLGFREYVKLIDPDWYAEHERDDMKRIRFDSSRLKIYLERYLITGGIPLVINEYEKNGEIPNHIFDLYYSWIIGDILKDGKNEQTAKELIRSIMTSYTTPVSWDSLAKRSSVRSHVTVSSYMELLSSIFVIFECYFYDINQKRVIYRKNKKLYFHDPFILNIFSGRLNLNIERERIIEGLVGAAIKRMNVMDEIHYTRVKRETDFIISPDIGIEVKYQNSISTEDLSNRKNFRKYFLLSKDLFGKDILPVHAFLFLPFEKMDIP